MDSKVKRSPTDARSVVQSAPDQSETFSTTLTDSVLEGLRAGQFAVAFQPVVHAQSRILSGVECLLRWQHPQYGLLLPGAFEQAFHDAAVAHEVTRFVLETACEELAYSARAGHALPLVAINIQPSQLLDNRLLALIRETTDRHGIHPSNFELELVESEDSLSLVATRAFTAPLRSIGVRLALDDFGTGYSSLVALAGAQVDTVKLAREFLRHGPLDSPTRNATLISSIIEMLDRLGLRPVVEGIETETQLNWLAQHTSAYAQGHRVGRPQFVFPRAAAPLCASPT